MNNCKLNRSILQTFRAHDRSHPQSEKIYAESKKISQEIIDHGYEYDPSWITKPIDENETTESILCGHSERLAIAWNFVIDSHAKQIQLTKNLRICGDCRKLFFYFAVENYK